MPEANAEQHEPGREHQIGGGQHVAPAMLIDHAAGERAEQAREQQRGREDAEEPNAAADAASAEIGSAKTAGR